jgi:hypothetical protein
VDRAANQPVLEPVVVAHRLGRDRQPAHVQGIRQTVPLPAAANFDPCIIDEQCALCDVCSDYRCEAGKCVEEILDGVTDDGCDDGLYCTGQELCSSGTCVLGVPPCTGGEVCDERQDICLSPAQQCSDPIDCDDGLECTDDSCDGGVCEYENACGPDAICLGPFQGNPRVCVPGRCCDGAGGCTREEYADCSGDWLAVGGASTACNELISRCPNYGAGIFAGSTSGPVVGPVSNLDCDDVYTIGDDYQSTLHNTGSDPPNDNFMVLELIRFVGGVFPGLSARWSIEFRDETGLLIERVFFPADANDSGELGIRTAIVEPPLIIPTKGFVSFSAQANFGLDGRVLLGTTTAASVGINDPDTMFVDWQIGDYLGVCAGGDRDGEACDRANGNADCTGGGICEDRPDVLSFELVGPRTVAPTGACCELDTGACTNELRWECLANGGEFQGEGTLCGICEDGITPCDEFPSDPVCIVECFPLPACVTQACCDANDGRCVATTAPTCSGTVCDNDPYTTGCTLDAECPVGGHCVPVTGDSQGFGTDCDPNCCEQPFSTYTGGDNCRSATVTVINVPPLGLPPVTVTITGDNAAATFDDFDLVCVDGPFGGSPCVQDSDCGFCFQGLSGPCAVDPDCDTSPGAGDGACDGAPCDRFGGDPIFDPDGDTKDPGWWEVFAVTDYAEIRIDLCCTDISGEALRPAWGHLYSDCPTGARIEPIGVDPPIGIGRETNGLASGAPFCNGENFWYTYLLAPGTYHYPIYSAPNGTSATPPGAQYQLHITASAAPVAACCLGNQCVFTHELDCAAQGGYWLIGVVDCGVDADCILPPGETDNPCCFGACCVGPGECEDDIFGLPMTLDDCFILDGEYVGGAICAGDPDNFLPPPCPTCPIDPDDCLANDGTLVSVSDLDAGTRWAEDFVAQSTTLEQVCVVGSYIDCTIDCKSSDSNWCDCSCDGVDTPEEFEALGGQCNPVVTDDFVVCVYEDAGASPDPGQSSHPGPLVECITATSFQTVNSVGPTFAKWDTALTFDIPIFGLVPGEVYWLEVTNNTTDPAGNTCDWNWAQNVAGGNEWSANDSDNTWTINDGRSTDMVLCLDGGIVSPIAPTGACCLCDPPGGCLDDQTRDECDDVDGLWIHDAPCFAADCPPPPIPGDDCVSDSIILPSVDEQVVPFTNVCSTTDGPDSGPCGGSVPTDVGRDIWFEYHASCDGALTISLCDDTDFDAVLAVYTDGTTSCFCPFDNSELLACADDNCCLGAGPGEVEFTASQGTCYLIRVAGWRSQPGDDFPECVDGCSGSGNLTITCESDPCGEPAAGPCCSANGTPGCDDDTCCHAVCDTPGYAYCCTSGWDDLCVYAAKGNPSCNYCADDCPCLPDVTNDNWCMPPDGTVNFPDISYVTDCFQDQQDPCGHDLLAYCDVNCDGTVDMCDLDVVLEAFLMGFPVSCDHCGACCTGDPDYFPCVRAGPRACSDVVSGTYQGDGSVCQTATPPVLASDVPDAGHGTRNRYLSVVPVDAGNMAAMRIKFKNLPPPHDTYNNDWWWVTEPEEVTYDAGSSGSDPPTFWAASLQCVGPVTTDWSEYDVVHVYHGGIVYGNDDLAAPEYEVEAIPVQCDPTFYANDFGYSPTRTIKTSGCGDVIDTNLHLHPPGPPNGGDVDFNDISYVVQCFGGERDVPCKPRADLTHNQPNIVAPPDRVIDFVDISIVVDAFKHEFFEQIGPQTHCP